VSAGAASTMFRKSIFLNKVGLIGETKFRSPFYFVGAHSFVVNLVHPILDTPK